MVGREPSVDRVIGKGEELIREDHFASDDIQQSMLELQSSWRELKLLASRRTKRLSDSQDAQKVCACVYATCPSHACLPHSIIKKPMKLMNG